MKEVVSTIAGSSRTHAGRPEACPQDELGRLMTEYERALLRFARSLVRDSDFALDCVQDTFLRAYESLCEGRPINQHWLFTVARNRAMDEFRRRRWLQSEPEHLLATSPDEASETILTVQQALDRLPPKYREVLCLFAVAGFKTEEIAELLGTTGPAVRQRLYRARQDFRRVYAEGQRDKESEQCVTRVAHPSTKRWMPILQVPNAHRCSQRDSPTV